MKKLGFLFAAALACVTAGVLPASASISPQYPPDALELTLTSSTATPGGTVGAMLGGCIAGGTVTFTLDGDTVSATSVETADGTSASATLTAPTTPGTYSIVATCVPTGGSETTTLTVAAAAPPAAPGGALPATGSDNAPTVQVATGIIAVGLGLAAVGGVRRRRRVAI